MKSCTSDCSKIHRLLFMLWFGTTFQQPVSEIKALLILCEHQISIFKLYSLELFMVRSKAALSSAQMSHSKYQMGFSNVILAFLHFTTQILFLLNGPVWTTGAYFYPVRRKVSLVPWARCSVLGPNTDRTNLKELQIWNGYVLYSKTLCPYSVWSQYRAQKIWDMQDYQNLFTFCSVSGHRRIPNPNPNIYILVYGSIFQFEPNKLIK